MNVVIINGNGGSGKDTFVRMCKLIDSRIENFSTIDNVKTVAKQMGWQDDKSEKGRKFLSDLKVLWDDYNGMATQSVVNRVRQYISTLENLCVTGTVFIHCREPENIKKLVEEFSDYRVITLLITNSNVPQITTNDSDKNVANYDYDFVIENNGTLGDLRNSARWFYYTELCPEQC